jgi:hypothetical protein
MATPFELWKPFVRKWEGGMGTLPGDSGGFTKWGVTSRTFPVYANRFGWTNSLRDMTEEQWDVIARDIFRMSGAHKVKHPNVAVALVDYQWHGGRYNKTYPVPSIESLNKMGPDAAFRAVMKSRWAYLKSRSIWKLYAKGLGARLYDLESKFGPGPINLLVVAVVAVLILCGAAGWYVYQNPSILNASIL